MKTRKNNEEKSKSKLSLQKKKTGVKKELKNILSVSHNVLNETCEFRQSSSIKEQKVTQCQVVVSEPENKMVDEETDTKKCPTCELSMPREAFQHHVTECLKNRFQKKETNEDVVPQEKFSCQFCLKDLSHYNSARKTQHLNRCMDQIDELKQKEMQKKEELEQARTAVLDCPMCGRTLKSENGRKVHMKKCCQNLGVSTDQLLDLIKKQEEERQINIAAGVVPQSVKAGSGKLNKQTKKQKLREPHSKYDEELQTALALSNSLHNSESSKKLEIQAPKQGKKKKIDSAPPPLVVLLSEEDKQKRLSERVAAMLLPQELEDEEDDVESLTPILSESQIKDKYSTLNKQFPSLWARCQLATEGLTCLEKKDTFYIERLMPPIAVSQFVVGSNIKKMDDIPGRRKSSYRGLMKEQEINLGSIDIRGDTLLASTQTAVVLAELEVSAMATPDLDLTCSGFCPDSPIKVQESTKQNVSEQHQKTMASLVNNPVYSDLKIKTSDGTIYAHRLILSARCPNVIQNCREELELTDFASDTVLTVMKFLYAGVICLPKGSVQEIKDLAARLELSDLVEICSSFIDKKKDEDKMEENIEEEEEQRERNFTDLTEDDREVDPEENEGCSSENNEWEELSDQDYNDIRCTQRRNYSQTDGKGKEEEDSEESVVDPEELRSDVSEEEIALFFNDDSFDGTSVKPSGDNDEEKSEIQDMEGFPEDGVTGGDQSVRKENLLASREEIRREAPIEDTDDEFEEEMDIDQKQEEGNKKSEEENNEEHIVKEKPADSILYQDEDVIIYSETEDTPPCSDSEKFRQSLSTEHQSEVLDRSGRASSPLVVDSDSSHQGSPERDISTEVNDREVGSPVPQALDSSGLDLFESPVLSRLAPEAADMQTGSQTSTQHVPPPSEEKLGPDTPARKRRRTGTSVKGSLGNESKRCVRYSDLENNAREFSRPQEEDDSRSKSLNDNTICSSKRKKGPKKTVTSTNSESDDEVSVIEDKCHMPPTVVSPVFGQQQTNERKTFRFTKTKPAKVNLQRVLSPEKSEEPAVTSCHVDLSPPEALSGQHHQQDVELVSEVVENELELGEPEQDVWEDFDDSGMGGCIVTCDVPIPSQSANGHKEKCATPIKPTNPIAELDTPANSSSGLKEQNPLGHRPEDQLMEESFEEDSFDVEMIEQETEKLNSFKTPTECRRPKRSKKDWVPPSPFTPMPSYDSMATPQLKREVQKIGVKPVGKKRMVLLLKDIYHQTHQYETDSEFEISVDETEQRKQGGPISVSDDEEEISSSQESERSVVLEESMIEEEETTSSQTGSTASELKQRISQFVLDTPDIYTRILMYEPLEFDALKRELTEAGIKCSMDKLLNYLDEKCITFTMKNRRKTSPKKGRGRGRKKKTAEPE
ncbi:structure-specific endonuclease subunit SLX4-like [Saccostrea echinata]|uniref:structure-specific endonuclease subunit SLX4-like n=1 Tax=Saccostrea echinata TaxID=191078 RepID=UPI002A802907|nr:structure-specific endonuclease subunit SLX4-like [Saccostrea echinata]